MIAIENPEDNIVEQSDNFNDAAGDLDEDDFGDEDNLISEKEKVVFGYDETERSLAVGDTKGKKEKSKARKQKAAKDMTTAKKKQDKLPKSHKP